MDRKDTSGFVSGGDGPFKMDLNNKDVQFPHATEILKKDKFGETSLSLKCFGLVGSNKARFVGTQSSRRVDYPCAPDDSCRLVLGLGPTPSAYSDEYYGIGVNKNKNSTVVFPGGLSSKGNSILQLGISRGTKEALFGLGCSGSTDTAINAAKLNNVSPDDIRPLIPVVDEGSTSAKKSGGYMPSLLFAPRIDSAKLLPQTQDQIKFGTKSCSPKQQMSLEPSSLSDFSVDAGSEQTMTMTSSDHIMSNPKKCNFSGCVKGARGGTGLCISHGGGQRCQKSGCTKGAESRTAYCKSHGGGKRCQHLGCTKSAEGKTDFCIAHGGGRRCGYSEGCSKAARGKSGLCIRHGGGKRCKMDGCTRSAEGQAGLCISHGGGRRCQYLACAKGAQGSTLFCKAHGGGKRCIFSGCNKGAEGSTPLCKGHGGGKRCLFDGGGMCPKSVHGGTNFCVAHGGGKRCVVPGCTKSARGRTDCCVRHGGGKRCRIENCGKSAQGSTDFCKAHGGGKRCSWGEGKCEKFARGKSGLCAAHSSMAQLRETNKRGLIGPGLFHGLVSATSVSCSSLDNNYSSSGISAVSDCTHSLENLANKKQLIPPQVLVPLSMKSSSSSYVSFLNDEKLEEERSRIGERNNLDFTMPEGRVHGAGLMMSLLGGGSSKNPIDGTRTWEPSFSARRN